MEDLERKFPNFAQRDELREFPPTAWFKQMIEELMAGLPYNSSSTKLESSRVVKAGPGLMFGFSVLNTNGAAQFIQVHDTAGIVPANGAVPVASFTVAASANLALSWIFPGRFFRQGMTLANSSTAATLTIGAADCFFDAQYA